MELLFLTTIIIISFGLHVSAKKPNNEVLTIYTLKRSLYGNVATLLPQDQFMLSLVAIGISSIMYGMIT